MPLAHFGGQVLHTHSLLALCHPSGHSVFPDPLNKPLLPWLPGAISCGSSLSGLSDPLSSTMPLSQLSEAAHLTSHILGPVSRSLLACLSTAHTATLSATLCDPPRWTQVSVLLCAPFSVAHPLLIPVQSSLPQSHSAEHRLHLQHMQRARVSSLPGPTAPLTLHVSIQTLGSHSDTALRDFRPLILLPHCFTTALSPSSHPLAPTPARYPRP